MVENGKLPADELASVQIGGKLRKDVTRQTNQLFLAFAFAFGEPLVATDTYRSYERQVQLKKDKPALSAAPGTSIHGLGHAVDFSSDIPDHRSPEHRWMDQNAKAFGFVNPDWAKDPNRFEPWHWEATHKDTSAPYIREPKKGELGVGSGGTDVEKVQKLLNEHGAKLKVDGGYGLRTAIAVAVFQRDEHNLSISGTVGPVTLARLKGEKDPRPENKGPVIYFQKGTKKADQVEKIQAFLNRVQKANLKVDGDFGEKTHMAVKIFQGRHVLPRNGKIGERTLAAMKKLGLEF